VNGQDTIKLVARRLAGRPQTVYVNPVTYRPVRIVGNGLRQDYRWLTPTSARLARLPGDPARIPPGTLTRVERAG
jgi:hypothetical protein